MFFLFPNYRAFYHFYHWIIQIYLWVIFFSSFIVIFLSWKNSWLVKICIFLSNVKDETSLLSNACITSLTNWGRILSHQYMLLSEQWLKIHTHTHTQRINEVFGLIDSEMFSVCGTQAGWTIERFPLTSHWVSSPNQSSVVSIFDFCAFLKRGRNTMRGKNSRLYTNTKPLSGSGSYGGLK